MKSKRLAIAFIIILIIAVGGIFCTYYFYSISKRNNINNNESSNLIEEDSNNFIEIYKKENDYKAYIKNDNNKEIDGYELYKTIGLKLTNETINTVETNINNNKLNGIVINYKERVENENAYKDLNNYYHKIDCHDAAYENDKLVEYDEKRCFIEYSSYYNLENNKNLFKEYKVEFAGWNNANISNYAGSAQDGNLYELIFNIPQEKIVLNNLKELGIGNIIFLESDNKNYIYFEGTNFRSGELGKKIFDANGNEILSISPDNYSNFSLIYEDGNEDSLHLKSCKNGRASLNDNCKVLGYYYAKNGIIEKHNMLGEKTSNSKKYNEVLFVLEDYSLIYNKSDDYVYVISNDELYSKKITKKTSDIYKALRIHFDNYNVIEIANTLAIDDDPCANHYTLDLNTDKLSSIEKPDFCSN